MNAEFFTSLKEQENANLLKPSDNILQDNRFKAMFEESNFEIDKQTPEYK